MPKDTREVLQNIILPVTEDNPVRRTLKTNDADEISEMFSQERLDAFVADGVLSGEWKSTQKAAADPAESKAKK